jgi:phosphoribosylcarboxyaminoimidazole (NCAIR) mutase
MSDKEKAKLIKKAHKLLDTLEIQIATLVVAAKRQP